MRSPGRAAAFDGLTQAEKRAAGEHFQRCDYPGRRQRQAPAGRGCLLFPLIMLFHSWRMAPLADGNGCPSGQYREHLNGGRYGGGPAD